MISVLTGEKSQVEPSSTKWQPVRICGAKIKIRPARMGEDNRSLGSSRHIPAIVISLEGGFFFQMLLDIGAIYPERAEFLVRQQLQLVAIMSGPGLA